MAHVRRKVLGSYFARGWVTRFEAEAESEGEEDGEAAAPALAAFWAANNRRTSFDMLRWMGDGEKGVKVCKGKKRSPLLQLRKV